MSNFIKPKMVRILNSLSIDMVYIKKGTFLMGEGRGRKEVTIESDFCMGKYPVTVAEYMHFAKETEREESREWEKKKYNHPVTKVSWHDAKAYCDWLSKKTGDTYRLPTEAEWEYACRAGTAREWSFGDNEKELEKYAWYSQNSDGTTHPVGTKDPNPRGLYDMHGNVWEWCEDWHIKNKDTKVLRGGSWNLNAVRTRSSYRGRSNPSISLSDVGFRLLRTLPS